MRKCPIHVTWAQDKWLNTLYITWGIKQKSYDKQFITVTTHKKVQNYYNEKCAKYLMFDLKKYWRVMWNLKKNLLVVWKMTWGIWQSFTRAIESLKIGILMGSFNLKYEKCELKTHREVMCHDNEE